MIKYRPTEHTWIWWRLECPIEEVMGKLRQLPNPDEKDKFLEELSPKRGARQEAKKGLFLYVGAVKHEL